MGGTCAQRSSPEATVAGQRQLVVSCPERYSLNCFGFVAHVGKLLQERRSAVDTGRLRLR